MIKRRDWELKADEDGHYAIALALLEIAIQLEAGRLVNAGVVKEITEKITRKLDNISASIDSSR